MQTICKICGQAKKLHARGLCRRCYGQQHHAGTLQHHHRQPQSHSRDAIRHRSKRQRLSLTSHQLTCMRCGSNVIVHTPDGEYPDPRRLCHNCKAQAATTTASMPAAMRYTHRALVTMPAASVTIYRPGDVGFTEIAKQCQQPHTTAR